LGCGGREPNFTGSLTDESWIDKLRQETNWCITAWKESNTRLRWDWKSSERATAANDSLKQRVKGWRCICKVHVSRMQRAVSMLLCTIMENHI
jgi:hypothetical protein